MPRKQPDLHRADELLDELLADCPSPEAILGESGLLKQLTQRLVLVPPHFVSSKIKGECSGGQPDGQAAPAAWNSRG
jgi:hypothetical protein